MYQIENNYLFPTQVVTGQIPNFDKIQKPMIDWINKYKSENSFSIQISNIGGWQSLSKQIYDDEGFKPFEEKIVNCINALCLEYKFFRPLNITSMWININGENSYNVSHRHPNALLSGVLWIKQSKEMGEFVFDNMDNGYRDADVILNTHVDHLMTNKMTPIYVPKYSDGTIMIFPANLSHRVDINKTKEKRYSISFNINFETSR